MTNWLIKESKNFSILAVDDDSLILSILEMSCKPFNMKATMHTAPSVHSAIDMCRRKQFDLLCLDHDLEGVRGWELLDYLRPHLSKDAKVLVYSSFVDTPSRQLYAERGVRDILRKPLSPSALGFAIRRALDI
jgi:CheY-like chemotaxis protein